MTSRDFDARTLWNYGARMPSDTREDYRARRRRDLGALGDVLAARAAWRAAHPHLPIFDWGSKWRAGAAYRRRTGRSIF